MKYIMGGADIEQVDFTNIECKNLTFSVVDLNVSGSPSTSFTFPKEYLKGKFLIRAGGLDANKLSLNFKIQQLQNGAWVDMPNSPVLEIVDGNIHTLDFRINVFKDIRLAWTIDDLTGDAGTNSAAPTLSIDLLI